MTKDKPIDFSTVDDSDRDSHDELPIGVFPEGSFWGIMFFVFILALVFAF